jgi:hypothetical protein
MAAELTDVQSDAKLLREAIADLPRLIDDFIAATGVSATNLGYSAVGNPDIVSKIRKGRNLRSDTLDKVLRFIVGYDPGRV